MAFSKYPNAPYVFSWLVGMVGASAATADGPRVSFRPHADHLEIRIDGGPFADYVFRDPKIPRPYFHSVHAPGSAQVTRNHPPIKGRDIDDHPTYHPGIWLAFGDISGADFWRNKARVRHDGFVSPPKPGPRNGSFAVRNRYEADGKTICTETCRYTILVEPSGCFLLCDSTFTGQAAFVFGDQEEMGLGLRVASDIAVKRGGRIVNSDGLENEEGAWGKQALWCDYGGVIDGKPVGITLMPHPKNFRPSWFHARDYGLLLANPFGRKAFGAGPPSKVSVKPGKNLRLRFGVHVRAGRADPSADIPRVYERYIELTR